MTESAPTTRAWPDGGGGVISMDTLQPSPNIANNNTKPNAFASLVFMTPLALDLAYFPYFMPKQIPFVQEFLDIFQALPPHESGRPPWN